MTDKPDLVKRRTVKMALATALTGTLGCTTNAPSRSLSSTADEKTDVPQFHGDWKDTFDGPFLGQAYWANPMEDWQVKNGRAYCASRLGGRNVHALTHFIEAPEKGFTASVLVTCEDNAEFVGGAGFFIGVKSEIDEYRSNCFANNGLAAGMRKGALFIGSKTINISHAEAVELTLKSEKQGQGIKLTLIARDAATQRVLASVEKPEAAERVRGHLALGANVDFPPVAAADGDHQPSGSVFSFSDWRFSGQGVGHDSGRQFGPIMWAMYALHNNPNAGYELGMTVTMAPLGEYDEKKLTLEIKQNGVWQPISHTIIDTLSSTGTFKINAWDGTRATPYRIVYRQANKKGTVEQTFEGEIKPEPKNRSLKMASLTCQNDYAFPYEPVASNVLKYNADLLFFSGDQIYESHGGFGIIRTPERPAMLNYLRKFYQFGWAFREAMRSTPTICLPDDHDVLQGNLWGEGGKPMDNLGEDATASILGGYAEPVNVVNAIHRTCVSHLPATYDDEASPYGISSYFTVLNYGDVSFAILADRQWKSAPDAMGIVVGETGQDEAPAYVNPDYDNERLQLLGEKQEAFLEVWAKDWQGHGMKAVLSQTVFAGISTHQPRPDRYLKYDFDSSGWPASARNRAIRIMRESNALHICGDTHLGTLSQYGVEQPRDSNWAFCSPAIAAGWPRWWLPDELGLPHTDRPQHGMENTGNYKDAFGNHIYVYAAANPQVGESDNRYIKAHEKGSGFGTIEFDTQASTFKVTAFKFNVDIADPTEDHTYPGYPVTIKAEENRGQNHLG